MIELLFRYIIKKRAYIHQLRGRISKCFWDCVEILTTYITNVIRKHGVIIQIDGFIPLHPSIEKRKFNFSDYIIKMIYSRSTCAYVCAHIGTAQKRDSKK
jgi:hypothetical protein